MYLSVLVTIFRRASLVTMVTAVVLCAGIVPAFAQGGDGSDNGGTLVRQAIAHLVHDPKNTMGAAEKINAAINAADTSGVDIALVTQAAMALEQGDSHLARTLLERSIGARPHMGGSDPQPIREVPSLAVGADTGIDVVTILSRRTGNSAGVTRPPCQPSSRSVLSVRIWRCASGHARRRCADG